MIVRFCSLSDAHSAAVGPRFRRPRARIHQFDQMRTASARLAALGLLMRASATALVWETLVTGHSSTNSYAGAIVNGEMVIFGGTTKLYRLDLESTPQQWRHIQPSGTAPSGSWSHMSGSRTHDELMIFGGNRDANGDERLPPDR